MLRFLGPTKIQNKTKHDEISEWIKDNYVEIIVEINWKNLLYYFHTFTVCWLKSFLLCFAMNKFPACFLDVFR